MKVKANQRLTSITICRGSPHLSHPFFTEDSLLFGSATMDENVVVKEILQMYVHASGQKVNLGKPSICFNKVSIWLCLDEIEEALEVGVMVELGKYLGKPYFIRRNKKKVFHYVEDRI